MFERASVRRTCQNWRARQPPHASAGSRRAAWRVSAPRRSASWRRRCVRTGPGCPRDRHRHRPEYRHHVWAYDFVADRTHDGRPLKIRTIVEEYSRECLAIVVARWLRSMNVLETLAELFVIHGVPAHIRSDNGLRQKSRRQSFSVLALWSAAPDAHRQAVPPRRNHTLTIVTQGQRSCGLP